MQRYWHNWTQLALWLLAGGLLFAIFLAFWWGHNERYRGVTWSAPAQPIAWTEVPQGGVNLPGIQLEPDPAVVSRTLDLAKAAGFRWLRVQFPWEDLEINGKGDFRDTRHDRNGDGRVDEADVISAWAKYDALVEAARSRGLELIVRLDRPPVWARQNLPTEPNVDLAAQRASDPGETGPPDSYSDYGDYVAAVVGRYQGKVRFFQIWNEPNLRHEWNWGRPDPAAFVELLKIGYTRAKAANPEALILFPSLTPADGLDWEAINDLDYLAAVYEHGAASYFDIFTAQGYGLGQPPEEHRYVRLRTDAIWSRPLDTRADVSRVVLLREIMERNGDGHKAVWISEFGWNSHPNPHDFGLPVSEEQKAAYLVGMMERARREWPWLGVMNVWFLRSGAGFNPEDPTVDFQLIRNDWTPTPAYEAVRGYLNGARTVGPGRYSAQHPAWRDEAEGRTLQVWGTEVALELEPGASVTVALDGGPPQTYTASGVIARDLALAPHTLRLTGGTPAAVLVSRSDAWQLFWTVAPWIWLIGMSYLVYRGLRSIWQL